MITEFTVKDGRKYKRTFDRFGDVVWTLHMWDGEPVRELDEYEVERLEGLLEAVYKEKID